VVYCGSSLALCVLESFVHLPPAMRSVDALPALIAVRVAHPPPEQIVRAEDLGAVDVEDIAACRAVGDAWVAQGAVLALSVPSVVVPQERNVVLNPAHPAMAAVAVVPQERFRLDRQLALQAQVAMRCAHSVARFSRSRQGVRIGHRRGVPPRKPQVGGRRAALRERPFARAAGKSSTAAARRGPHSHRPTQWLVTPISVGASRQRTELGLCGSASLVVRLTFC
jgi:RES domain-containing protein